MAFLIQLLLFSLTLFRSDTSDCFTRLRNGSISGVFLPTSMQATRA